MTQYCYCHYWYTLSQVGLYLEASHETDRDKHGMKYQGLSLEAVNLLIPILRSTSDEVNK